MEYDSADLLTRLRREIKRPLNDAASNNTDDLYDLLTEGLRYTQALMANHGFEMAAINEQAATSDNIVYTIQHMPVGQLEVRDGPKGCELYIGPDSDPKTDLIWEGMQFRAPEQRQRVFANGLWVRYTPEHGAISASVEPTLLPIRARYIAVLKAAELWMDRGGFRDSAPMTAKLQRVAFGDPSIPGDTGIIGSRKQGWSSRRAHRAWWRGNPNFHYPSA